MVLVSSEPPRSRAGPEMAQLPQTFARKNWKTSFLNENQKVELVIRLFSYKQVGQFFYEISSKQGSKIITWEAALR